MTDSFKAFWAGDKAGTWTLPEKKGHLVLSEITLLLGVEGN